MIIIQRGFEAPARQFAQVASNERLELNSLVLPTCFEALISAETCVIKR